MRASLCQRWAKGDRLARVGFFCFRRITLTPLSGDSECHALWLFPEQATQRARHTERLFSLYYYIILLAP
jgi:hypothetical protein